MGVNVGGVAGVNLAAAMPTAAGMPFSAVVPDSFPQLGPAFSPM